MTNLQSILIDKISTEGPMPLSVYIHLCLFHQWSWLLFYGFWGNCSSCWVLGRWVLMEHIWMMVKRDSFLLALTEVLQDRFTQNELLHINLLRVKHCVNVSIDDFCFLLWLNQTKEFFLIYQMVLQTVVFLQIYHVDSLDTLAFAFLNLEQCEGV